MNQGTPFALYMSFILMIVGCLTDGLDGYIARLLKSETKLGAMLDQMADKFFMTSILLMMMVLKWIKGIDIIAVFIVLFRDFAISGLRQCYAIKTDPLGKIKTGSLTFALLLIFINIVITPLYGLDRFALWGACSLSIVSFMNYIRYV